MTSREIREYAKLNAESSELFRMAMNEFGLSARAYNKILKVARTIADLEGVESIQANHVSEAVSYRTLDRKYWE